MEADKCYCSIFYMNSDLRATFYGGPGAVGSVVTAAISGHSTILPPYYYYGGLSSTPTRRAITALR